VIDPSDDVHKVRGIYHVRAHRCHGIACPKVAPACCVGGSAVSGMAREHGCSRPLAPRGRLLHAQMLPVSVYGLADRVCGAWGL